MKCSDCKHWEQSVDDWDVEEGFGFCTSIGDRKYLVTTPTLNKNDKQLVTRDEFYCADFEA